MNKRLLLINGLAIIGVVVSHAFGWGQGVMTSEKWQGIFQTMGLWNYDRFESSAYFILTSIRMMATFCVPTFFFVTGFFIAYANRGNETKFTYKVVFSRILILLIPYTIWSILIFAAEYLIFKQQFTLLEYLWIYISFGATIHYYYVPALCWFYIFTPWLVPQIKKHSRLVLIFAIAIQLFLIVFNWLTTYQFVVIELPYPFSVTPWFPSWWISRWVFFGTLGIICGFNADQFKKWLEAKKKVIVAGAGISMVGIIIAEIIARTSGAAQAELIARIIEQVYALFFIFAFLVLKVEKLPFARQLNWLSGRIYGIYLLHFTILDYLAHGLGVVFPFILGYQILFQILLITAGLGGPILFMIAVSRSPFRKYYRYLFG
jgi:hypothetical protein